MDCLQISQISDEDFENAILKLVIKNIKPTEQRVKYTWTDAKNRKFELICAIFGIKTVTPTQILKYFNDSLANREIIGSKLQKYRQRLMKINHCSELENYHCGGKLGEIWLRGSVELSELEIKALLE